MAFVLIFFTFSLAGSSRRTTASTQMNAESSRSHLICSLKVNLVNRRTGVQTFGKLTLVDLAGKHRNYIGREREGICRYELELALISHFFVCFNSFCFCCWLVVTPQGSERVDKSGAEGEMLKEAQSINKSLSALGDVIAALTQNSAHVPYRNHPLTMLMSDSIGGNAKTLMFVNCSPASYNIAESNSSLAFAQRCKDITNCTSSAPAMQAAQMNALKKELAKLKKGGGNAGGPSGPPPVPLLQRPV